MDKPDHIQQGLEHEAQQIEERIPMSKDDFKQTAARLSEFAKQNGLSNTDLGRALGVSKTAASQFKNGKYKGDVAKLANKAAGFMDNAQRRARQKKYKPGYVETTVARQIKMLIVNTIGFSDAVDEGKIGIIIGDGGHGKSLCMKAYAKADRNAVYCQLDDSMSVRGVFMAIAEAVGLESYGTQEEVTRRIIDTITHRDTLVLLDECSSLTVGVLNRLRQVIVVKARTPLILAGNRGLLTTIIQPTTKRGAESLDQFTSRMMPILNLDEMASRSGGGGLYTVDDITRLYQYGGVRLLGGAAEKLADICRTPRSGRLRTCDLIVSALHTSSQVKKAKQITVQNIFEILDRQDLLILSWLLPKVKWGKEIKEEAAAATAG